MKLKIGFLLLFISATAVAQVGVGTTSPNATLDVAAINPSGTATNVDGMLIPRVTRERAESMTSVPTSTLIYVDEVVTGTGSGTGINITTVGFYFFNGITGVWEKLTAGSSNTNWSITGNTGTSASTHFLGTTDDVDVVFKRNGIRAGFIGNPNTSTGNMNTSFGANSLNPAGTGKRNVAIGSNVLSANTNGEINVAVGEQAMNKNTTGDYNVALGAGALFNNTTGDANMAIGRNALLLNTSGLRNTALGYASLRSVVSGENNVALGFNAGYNETGSNKLYIHSSTTNTLATTGPDVALIYGEFNNKILRVNGQLQISNTTAERYSLPTTRGTAGQVLTTDGAGTTSWVSNTYPVMPFTTTGAATGTYNVSVNEYTVRVYNGVSGVQLPSAVLNPGRIYIIIGNNAIIGSKAFTSVSGAIHDDLMGTITTLSAGQRYMVQSDGTNWIVIGN